MLTHEFTLDSMITGTMVPIPKCKTKRLCCSDHYRAITLSSVIGKVFDWVKLIKEHNALNCSKLQFGFKSDTSATHCTFVMNEQFHILTPKEVMCILLY